MNDHLLGQILAGFIAILIGALGAVSIKQRASAAGKAAARDDAESGLFESALGTMAIDRDRWRKSAEEAWALLREREVHIAQLESDARNAASEKRLRASLARRFPEMANKLIQDSAPTGFDELAPTRDRSG